MPVTLRSKDRAAAVALVAKECVSHGEQVTIIVPSLVALGELRAQFTQEELANVRFRLPGGLAAHAISS